MALRAAGGGEPESACAPVHPWESLGHTQRPLPLLSYCFHCCHSDSAASATEPIVRCLCPIALQRQGRPPGRAGVRGAEEGAVRAEERPCGGRGSRQWTPGRRARIRPRHSNSIRPRKFDSSHFGPSRFAPPERRRASGHSPPVRAWPRTRPRHHPERPPPLRPGGPPVDRPLGGARAAVPPRLLRPGPGPRRGPLPPVRRRRLRSPRLCCAHPRARKGGIKIDR